MYALQVFTNVGCIDSQYAPAAFGQHSVLSSILDALFGKIVNRSVDLDAELSYWEREIQNEATGQLVGMDFGREHEFGVPTEVSKPGGKQQFFRANTANVFPMVSFGAFARSVGVRSRLAYLCLPSNLRTFLAIGQAARGLLDTAVGRAIRVFRGLPTNPAWQRFVDTLSPAYVGAGSSFVPWGVSFGRGHSGFSNGMQYMSGNTIHGAAR